MRIGVTGGTGFVGRYILANLIAAGHECRAWYRPESDRSGLEGLADRLTWVPGGLGDRASARALVHGCDAVVHAALDRAGPRFQGDEGDLPRFVERNVVGTIGLIEAARDAEVNRFVVISSCAVHDKILNDRPLDETHPNWPASHYGAAKVAVEAFVHSYGLQGFPICALRPTGIYGLAHPAPRSKWFELVHKVARGDDVECRRGGKEVHVADVARAVSILLEAEGIAGEVYNCCDRYISDYEVAAAARALTGAAGAIRGGPTGPRNQIVTAKLEALGMRFGGRPLLEQTVGELIAANPD